MFDLRDLRDLRSKQFSTFPQHAHFKMHNTKQPVDQVNSCFSAHLTPKRSKSIDFPGQVSFTAHRNTLRVP